LVKHGRPDRGIKRARYHVLRNAPCPAILVEVGFLSNTSEARRLETSDYRQRLAEAIIAGIRTYVD
jgi:N-acetylmuramoyl-L-alanine amidase